jgi:hypothetical protein
VYQLFGHRGLSSMDAGYSFDPPRFAEDIIQGGNYGSYG